MPNEQKLIEFFQDYCTHHETIYKFSALTAQIYTYIMFNKGGVSFDDIVKNLNASKSSVSTSLNLLSSNGQIEHFNKINERKRYFRLNPNYLGIHLQLIREMLEEEKKLLTKMQEFQKEETINSNCNETKINLYLSHLAITVKNLTDTITKLKNHTESL